MIFYVCQLFLAKNAEVRSNFISINEVSDKKNSAECSLHSFCPSPFSLDFFARRNWNELIPLSLKMRRLHANREQREDVQDEEREDDDPEDTSSPRVERYLNFET